MSDSDEEITEITANEPAEKAPNVADQDDLDQDPLDQEHKELSENHEIEPEKAKGSKFVFISISIRL